nr:hypothetical protein [Tanacetum cinerariifolium]
MSTPTFAETHNLIAFLEKPIASDRFEQIVDFLNANSVKYALTVSPTIYIACIKQFWTSAKVRTVNENVRLQALVDGKKVIVNEASIRRNLRLDDAEGTACLPNAAIFKELARMGEITPLFKTMMVQAPEEVGEIPTNTQDTPILTQPSSSQPQRKHKSRGKQRKATKVPHTKPQTREHIPTPLHDPLPSGEDRLQLNELMEICTKLCDMVLSLEQIKTNQTAKIKKLKKRVKKLECKKKKKTHGLKRLYKVSLSARIISSDEEGLGRMNDQDMFGVNDLDGDEVVVDVSAREKEKQSEKVTEKEVSTGDPVTTVGEVVTTVDVEVSDALTTTTTTTDDELTLAQTLIKIKAAKPKALTTAATTVTIVSTRPKEKGIIMKRGYQGTKDEANKAVIEEWDDVLATIDADRQLAKQLQTQEREQLSVEEKYKLLVELIESRSKYFAAKRAEEIRNKPPTKAQQKTLMCTYMKNIEGYKQKDFKG